MTDTSLLMPGFADAVFDGQAAFRAVLDALAYAGRVHEVASALDGPAPLHPATTALALSLFDFETPIWLDAATGNHAVAEFLKFHAGCPIVAKPADAGFAVIADPASMPLLDVFYIGEDRYPDRSATLVIQVESLVEGQPMRWTGPGIKDSLEVGIGGLPDNFWHRWALNHELYPLGLDVIFVSGTAVVGMPRGIKVEGV